MFVLSRFVRFFNLVEEDPCGSKQKRFARHPAKNSDCGRLGSIRLICGLFVFEPPDARPIRLLDVGNLSPVGGNRRIRDISAGRNQFGRAALDRNLPQTRCERGCSLGENNFAGGQFVFKLPDACPV